jgi:hypothetical protein
LPKNKTKYFDKFYRLSNEYDVGIAKLETSNFLNSELPIDSANYLSFKFSNSENSVLANLIKKDFFRLDDTFDYEDEFEDSFTNYSKIRNNFSKFQIGKFSDSYIPITAVSTFLSSIPNLSSINITDENLNLNFFLNKKKNIGNNNTNIFDVPSFFENKYSSIIKFNKFFKKPT